MASASLKIPLHILTPFSKNNELYVTVKARKQNPNALVKHL